MSRIPHIFILIGQRAATIAERNHREVNPTEVAVVVMAAHERRALCLQELLETDDGNFAHDVFGIMRHIDVATGEMRDCFSPRFTKRQAA